MEIPTIKENKMAEGIKGLIGRKMTKSVKFMGQDVTIAKLSVAEVKEIQARAKALTEQTSEDFDILRTVIKLSVEGANDLTDQDFDNFPLDELNQLSSAIMTFSGIGEQTGK